MTGQGQDATDDQHTEQLSSADDAAEEALLETGEAAEKSSDSIVELQIISDNDFHVITEPTTGLEITLAVTVLAADADAGAETPLDPTEPADTPSPSAPAAGGDAGAGQGPQAAPAGGLAQTGATVAVISLLAVLLLAVGAFLVIRQRRATALK